MIVPILRIGDNLVTSIQAALTDQQAHQFQREVLEAVARAEVFGIVIDITALDVVDSYMARILNDTVNNVHLLGTKSVIVGIRPEVAMTLVRMGRRLIGVGNALNLQEGLKKLERMQQREQRGMYERMK